MINKKIENAFNEQINAELYSAYLYASMESYFASMNLAGFANWMHVQAMEEMTHALKFFNYLVDRSGRALLKPIAGPPMEWKSPLAVFENAYQHEQKVTGLINNLVSLAMEEKDYAANMFLLWFVNEQVEEEKNADSIVQKLKLIGADTAALYLLDKELAMRVFTPPAATQGA